MGNHVLNIINQFLCYSDPSVTNNPHQRAFDHTRRLESIGVSNPISETKIVSPSGSVTLFNGTVPTGLTGSSVLSLNLINASQSAYRLSVTGPVSFRTERLVSGLSSCSITINNNTVAEFDFSGANLSSVQVGDIMRIKGTVLNDLGPFAFNPLNSGIWYVISVSGTKVLCVRQVGEPFSGINESVSSVASDVMFYSSDGVQVGHKISISGTFSVVSHRVYEIKDVTPNTIDFVSVTPIPNENNINYVLNSVTVYSSSKKFIYIEVDQDSLIKFNNDTGDSVKLNPIKSGDSDYVAFLTKWGDTFSCQVTNKSINPLRIKYLACE